MWVLLYVAHCCKLLLYAISTKTNEAKLRQWQKPRFWSNFGPFDPNLGCQFYFIFFPKIWLSVTRYYGQLSSCTISEKTNDSIQRKLGDGGMDIQTDKSDFIGCCPTNVKHPIWMTMIFKNILMPVKLLLNFLI